MRHLLTLFILCFLSSCNLDEQSNDKEKDTNNAIQKVEADSLIGEWGIYMSISEGDTTIETLCNACPRIAFSADQTAVLATPSGDKGKLRWTVNKRELTLIPIDKSIVERVFSGSLYEMTFTNRTDFVELKLRQSGTKYSQILRR